MRAIIYLLICFIMIACSSSPSQNINKRNSSLYNSIDTTDSDLKDTPGADTSTLKIMRDNPQEFKEAGRPGISKPDLIFSE